MPILSIMRDWGTNPAAVRITTSDSLASVATSNYLLSQASVISSLNNGTWEWVVGDLVAVSASDGDNFFRFNGNDFNTLVVLPSSGGGNANVVFPVVSGNFVVFDGTAGDLNDLGYKPSDASKTDIVMSSGTIASGNIPEFSDIHGTIVDSGIAASSIVTSTEAVLKTPLASQNITVGNLGVDAGSLISGKSTGGTVGTLQLFPTTASKGSLSLSATPNSGNTASIITTDAFGQPSTISVSDPGNADARLLIAAGATPFTNGNFPQNSGTQGLMIDSGVSVASIAALASPIGKVTYIDFDILASDLASGGMQFLIPAVGGQSFKIRYFMFNSSTNTISMGDRNIILTDGSDPFGYVLIESSIITGSPTNAQWGTFSGVNLATDIPQNQTSIVGAGLWFEYFSGSTDYDTGTFSITVAIERIT